MKKGGSRSRPWSIHLPASSGHDVQIADDLSGMVGRGHFVIRCGNLAVGADQHRFAWRARAVRFRNAEGDGYCTVLVAEQVVGEGEFVAKRAVIRRAVIGEADDGCVAVFEVLDSITEPVAFDGSAGCVGFGIPPEQDVTAGEIVFLHRLSVLVREAEIRRVRASGDQCHSSCSIESVVP